MSWWRGGAAWLAALYMLPAPVHATPAPPPEDFFRSPQYGPPALSPSGRYLAFSMQRADARASLMVLDLEGQAPPKAVGFFRDTDVNRVWWVNEERLVFDSLDRDPGRYDYPGPGLWGVDRDGANFRYLIRSAAGGSGSVQAWGRGMQFVAVPQDGSDDVLARAMDYDSMGQLENVKLYRLNTRDGKRHAIGAGGPAHARAWVLDPNGRPAAVTTYREGRYAVHLHKPEGWQRWLEGDALKEPEPYVQAVDAQGGIYLVKAGADGLAALYRLAPGASLETARPLLQLDGYDFRGSLIFDAGRKRLLGVRYETDAPGTLWFDTEMKAIQQRIDTALPGSVNLLSCSACENASRLLVTALSDRQPPVYYLYHRATQTLKPLLLSHPWLRDRPMGRRDLQRFAARDGLPIPTLLTWPATPPSGPLPAVVLVHGGPWVRGAHWPWEAQAQFLASRGYLVIEPEFRGSLGYGFKHHQAGWKQWGLAMQDDLADALDWTVKQGWVDPQRVCIAGASYGGYAALMGLVRHHDKYRCAINWAGVTDIQLMYSIHWSDTSDQWKRLGMPVLVGDPKKDVEQLKATSPVEQADRVRRPVLLAYGDDDYRVPLDHGLAFRNAVRRHNSQIEWVIYKDEGHGWLRLQTEVDFWNRVDRFLARHIGADAAGR